MKKILSVYKPVGKTPYEVIQQLKKSFPEYHDFSITYAGRLDPLAHGVLILLVDDAIEKKDQFLSLPKIYEYELVFGIETDSYDFLGLVKQMSVLIVPADLEAKIAAFVAKRHGKQTQTYPPFSSKTVDGKPLFWWTKEHRLDEITIPTRDIEIFDFQLLQMGECSSEALEQQVMNAVKSVSGDFRQEETITRWQEFFAANPEIVFTTARFRITCSSGTYVRGLVHELGQSLGTGAVTSEILRTKVGEFELKDSLRLIF